MLISWGIFKKDGSYIGLPQIPIDTLRDLFMHKILKMLILEDAISCDVAEQIKSWPHSGFHAWISNLISCLEKRKLECLGRYQTRGPVSLERLGITPGGNESKGKLSYEEGNKPENSKVILVGEKVIKKHGGNRREWDPLSFIADLTCHIPDFRSKMTLYYGYYSNKKRGQRKKAENVKGVEVITEASEDQSSLGSSHWARLIKKIYEVDPLECPKCKNEMRIIACIDQPDVIHKILSHLDLLGRDCNPDEDDGKSARAPP